MQTAGAPNKLLITIVVMSATVMQVLDTTIVNVALPDMQGSFSAAPDEITWILTSYLVSSAICMPLTGYLVDRIGRKPYLIWSMVGFTITSMLCGLSESLGEIVVFRALQGVFGAGLVPLSQSILADTYPVEERGRAMSIWGTGVMLGPILGPTLGGYFTEYFNWRWNFYINLPVGIVTILLAMYYIHDSEIKERKLDWTGFGLLSLGVGALQFALDRGNQDDWLQSNVICMSAGLALIGIIGFVLYSSVNKDKCLFSMEVISNRNFCAASIIMACLGMGFYGAMVLQPIMLNNLFNYPEFTIGLVMMPRGIASMFSMLFVNKLMKLYHPRYILLAGLCMNMIGNYGATFYTLDADIFWMVWPILFQGVGIGLSFIPLSTMCLSTMPQQYMSEATGLFSLMRTIGFSAGISVVITYYTRQGQESWNTFGGFINQYNPNLETYFANLGISSTDPLAIQLLGVELGTQAQMQSLIDSFFLLTTCFIFMLPLVFLLEGNKKIKTPVTHVEG